MCYNLFMTQDEVAKFSNREKQVLEYTVQGLSNTQIAEKLNISQHTVKAYLEHLYQKLNVHNKVQLAVYVVQNGLF